MGHDKYEKMHTENVLEDLKRAPYCDRVLSLIYIYIYIYVLSQFGLR
jgi:hypothetical protein